MRVTGHVDAISVQGSVARILDHKTGRKDSDYSEQALGYCALVLLQHPELDEATCTVLWVRDQEVENYGMTRAQVGPWLDRLRLQVVEWDQVWRPGSHCEYCPRSHECPARRAIVRRDVEALAGMDVTEEALAALSPKQRIDLVIKARAVEKIAARVVGAIKDDVVRNGDVEADGMRLTVQRTERRRLNVLQAFPILQEKLEDTEMAEVIDISIAKAEQAVREKAGRGKGAGAVRALNKELTAAGAIEVGVTTSLVVRRAT